MDGRNKPSHKRLDITGQRFGRLTAVRPTGGFVKRHDRDTNASVCWLFKCDCGKEIERGANAVKAGRCLSCGCSRKKKTAIELANKKAWFDYRARAKAKGFEFSLERSQFEKMVVDICHYCRRPPMFGYRQTGGLINGIDRVDSDRGYTINNVVTCCKICNAGKKDLSYEEFMLYLKCVRSTR
jgi:hypothetical protein